MLNHIVLMGRLTRDVELRRTGSGIPVASFTIAVDRDGTNKQTNEKETDFIDIVAWRSTAEFVEKYFTKGRMAVVSGRLQIRNWTDKDGNKRRTAEVIAESVYFGDSKKDDSTGQAQNFTGGSGNFSSGVGHYGGNLGGYGQQSGGFGGYTQPASDFAMLEDDDAKLPF